MIALSQPLVLGMVVGTVCVQMVSFDVRYRHLGRLLFARRGVVLGAFTALVALVTLWAVVLRNN